MNILSITQYNQSVGKSKLLSSTSGVGSVITTKAGYYILISDINQWRFIKSAQNAVEEVRKDFVENDWLEKGQKRIHNLGIFTIDDERFVQFLRSEKDLPNLLCLIAIPHLSVHEHYNTVNVKDNPIIKLLKERDNRNGAEDLMVFGTHFPKWFKNRKGELKLYKDWKERWREGKLRMKFFAPPRDAEDPICGADRTPLPPRKTRDADGTEESVKLFHQLSQTNLALICPNGHLSDVPWSRFLSWKSEKGGVNDKGRDLFSQDQCCPSPKLKWTESTTKSEGYSSIFIECDNCRKKENLEGINNLSPFCIGEKPWQIDLDSKDDTIPRDPICTNALGASQTMQVALVTGNNMYFATGFSSLYVPKHLLNGVEKAVAEVLDVYEKKYQRYLEFSPSDLKEEFFNKMMTVDKLASDGYDSYINNIPDFHQKLKTHYLKVQEDEVNDTHEHYRWQEYNCFINNDQTSDDAEDLAFKDVIIPNSLKPFFNKIQQVNELKVCQVQLDFTRVKPNERLIKENTIVNSAKGQNIFSKERSEVFILPATTIYGEGIFFGFNEEAILSWYNSNQELISSRLDELIGTFEDDTPGAGARQRMRNDGLSGAKYLLIHTFSHLIMRELEFSCGYPTASLKERLYLSDRMSGLLIYTAEGSEGSMGGLVWQGQPENIEKLINKALERALDCSSDPLCWENDGQGLFNLNYAACFSCCHTSETACEAWNLGLDRRILLDDSYGFFSKLLSV